MSERWKSELSKLRRAELPAELWERIGEGPRLEPLHPRAGPRVVAALTALTLFAGAVVLLWAVFAPSQPTVTTLTGPEVLDVPPRGQVAPEFLPNGRPIFVVSHEDGTVSVVDAFSSHRAWGFEELVAWCPSSRHFVEVAHEAHFDEYGNYSAGPAPTGISTFEFEVVERDAAGDPASIRVGAMREPDPGHGPLEGDTSRPPFCPPWSGRSGPVTRVTGGYTGEVADVVAHMIDESSIWKTPADVVAAEPDGWIAVKGRLLVSSEDGFVQLCASVEGEPGQQPGSPDPRRCESGATVRGIAGGPLFVEVLVPNPGSAYEEPGVFLARVGDGVLDDLAGADFLVRS